MATQETTAVDRYRRPRGQHPRPRRDVEEKTVEQLPEYLEAHEVDALIRAAPNPRPGCCSWSSGGQGHSACSSFSSADGRMKQPDSQSVRRIRETLVQDAGASRRITGNAVRSAASRAARRARSAGRGAGGLARDAVEGAVHAVGEIGGETRAFVKDAVIGERLSKVPLA